MLDADKEQVGTVPDIWAERTSVEIQEVMVARGRQQQTFVAWDDIDVVCDAQQPMLKLRAND